ncbi:MAG: signal peptidase I [Lentisphaerae bacterium]|nr:signal peptidase I [Lentisphaerota bacterium]
MKKLAQRARHLVRHAVNMRGDVAAEADVAAARAAEAELKALWVARDWERLEAGCEAAAVAAERVMPPRPLPQWRENLEVLVVAISLAMACRTYFIQPFKIPTGSMQPTLNGVTVRPQEGRGVMDRFPLMLVNLALFGERYVEVKAQAAGVPELVGMQDDQYAFRIGGRIHLVRLTMRADSLYFNPDPAKSMKLHFRPGERVARGQVIASGRVRMGDHIFVNKVRYHFARPRRGHVVVFDTNYIPQKERFHIRPDTFYIKRLVGLPGETVAIRGRRLVVDGEVVDAPMAFRRQAEDPAYDGYVSRPDALLADEDSRLRVGPHHFLPFGDNTYSSLDGRYFGAVDERALVGPSFFVYWPLGRHWGLSI